MLVNLSAYRHNHETHCSIPRHPNALCLRCMLLKSCSPRASHFWLVVTAISGKRSRQTIATDIKQVELLSANRRWRVHRMVSTDGMCRWPARILHQPGKQNVRSSMLHTQDNILGSTYLREKGWYKVLEIHRSRAW